jgi:hypothetical protein
MVRLSQLSWAHLGMLMKSVSLKGVNSVYVCVWLLKERERC